MNNGMKISPSADTNISDARQRRMSLCKRFANHDSHLRAVPHARYPEAHEIIRRILRGERVTDNEVEWAHGVVEGIRRTRRLVDYGLVKRLEVTPDQTVEEKKQKKDLGRPREPYPELSELLRKIRTDSGVTQRELARRFGRRRSFVWKTERDGRRLDAIELVRWCQACGVDPSSVFSQIVLLLESRGTSEVEE